MLDYEKDAKVDPSELDVELLRQTSLALKYGRHHAEWTLQVAQLTERKKTLRSELIQQANENPERCCGKPKPNASDIEAYYRTRDSYIDLIKELLQAEYELQMAGVAKWEIAVTRKEVVENLVRLHGQQYFAGPSVPRDLSKEWKQKAIQEKVNEGISKKMRRGTSKK